MSKYVEIVERIAEALETAGITDMQKAREAGSVPPQVLTLTRRLSEFRSDLLNIVSGTVLREENPLHPGESAVAAWPTLIKTAALGFDRVWADPGVPRGISFNYRTESEVVQATIPVLLSVFDKDDPRSSTGEPSRRTYRDLAVNLAVAGLFPTSYSAAHGSFFQERFLAEEIAATVGQHIETFLPSEETRRLLYKEGDARVVVAALRDLQIVDERALSWAQVIEFRRDKDAKRNLRRLMHWLDEDCVGRSESFVIDEIGCRLEKYESALSKHGVATKVGVLSSMLDWRVLAAAAGASQVAPSGWGALLAGGVVVGNALVSVGRSSADLKEIHTEHAEVAFVHALAESTSG